MKDAKIISKAPLKSEKISKGISFSRGNLCLPYGLFLAVFVVFPLLLIVFYAFTGEDGKLSLQNFITFFTDTTNLSTLIISVFVSFLVTLICLIIAYPVAYILSRMKGNVALVLLLLFILPSWLNFVLRAMAMKELLSLLGRHKVQFNWVKGHAGHRENERCDQLASGFAEKLNG